MKNIIFDVGNVLLKWDPISIIKQAFPVCTEPEEYLNSFKDIISELDAGSIDETVARKKLRARLNSTYENVNELFKILVTSLTPLPGSFELLETLANKTSYSIYCLTNMSMEIFKYLKNKYTFWDNFKGIVVSADIKLVKPDPKIYGYLLNKFNLIPKETVFIDDLLDNVVAARKMGIVGIQFTDLASCKNELKLLNII
jgi:putative hydrolase of the HAD superfamily